ncbi:hypothetical protein NESM_000212900 [Novymonas esmeraldas]|uniref:Uncharacterized protein n=1 Tax=Novymonas esmeraldas TaxID=1808958 RepID=A0AAW0F967_9TRYP
MPYRFAQPYLRRLSAAERAHLPEALPCTNSDEVFADAVCPVGNIVVACPEEMQVWSLVTSPVCPTLATRRGGCIQYVTRDARTPVRYYQFCACSEEVYGRCAPYQRRLSDRETS